MYAGSQAKRERNPKEKANFLSVLTFLFTRNIFKKTRKRELEEEDIYEVLNNVQSNKLGDALENEWNKEKLKEHTSFTRTLLRVFGREYIIYGLINLIFKTGFMVIKPLAIGRLVAYFTPGSNLTIQDAYYYAAIVIACTYIRTTFIHWYMLNLGHLGLRLRVSICSLIFRKSLKLTSSSLIEITNGKIVTMISKDVVVFDSAIMFAHDVWVGLIQIVIMTYIMYRQIQVAALIGVGFLILLVPIQIWIGKKTTGLRLKTSAKTDERLRGIQEVLTSIKMVKQYTWENYYTKLTSKLRVKEMKNLRSIFYLKSIILSMAALGHRISFYICIVIYIYLENTITPEKVFVIIGCYGSLRYVLSVAVPMSVAQLAEAKSSIKRIKKYLLTDEVTKPEKENIISAPKIIIENAHVEFLNKTILKNINLEISPSLVGVTGGVGTGKSTLLKLILNDVRLSQGTVHTSGIVSYASQEPWLFPGTIKQNILFGLPYERERYQTIVKICALARDLESFPERDNTIVNDKGLNLSKGQQARINLARAIYKRSRIYLLDDIMSSLDASVSKFIFNSCMKTFLQDSICVIVCHNKRFLCEMDKVIVMDDGKIKAFDTYEKLENQGIDFGTTPSVDATMGADEVINNGTKANENENADENANLLVSVQENLDNAGIYGENKQQGKVQFDIYRKYFTHLGGWKYIPAFLVLALLGQLATSYFDVFITKWLAVEQKVSDLKLKNITDTAEYQETQQNHTNAMYMYSVIITAATILTTARLFAFFGLSSRASSRIHDSVFTKITGACMSFFDQNLSGNILNRFSKDFCTIDEYLPYSYFECIRVFFIAVGVTAVITFINPFLLGPTACFLGIMLIVRYYFLSTSRCLKRLDGTIPATLPHIKAIYDLHDTINYYLMEGIAELFTEFYIFDMPLLFSTITSLHGLKIAGPLFARAPVIGYLNASLEGLTTIRASGIQSILVNQFDRHQDLNSSAAYMILTTTRAFGFWLDMLCSTYISIIVLSFLYFDASNLVAGKVGLAITQAVGLTGMLQWGIRQWTEVENQMTSMERVVEYEKAEQEDKTGLKLDTWPTAGEIEYRNVSLKYSNSDKYVLNNLNFVIKPQEKIGIIGRTGAGKSSIIAALFRLYKIVGSIIIDDVDIKNIELDTVRSRISIIPQDPVLFAGTIRSNLDPDDKYNDSDLWAALNEVELKNVIANFEMGLMSVVNGGGANFSVGQRQLICLARAIIRNNKILILDEATANIDPNTDELIQKTIKRLFHDCTILTIAHRLNTIINSDKIMVLDFGSVIEYDTPAVLLGKRDGIFYSMARQAGLVQDGLGQADSIQTGLVQDEID